MLKGEGDKVNFYDHHRRRRRPQFHFFVQTFAVLLVNSIFSFTCCSNEDKLYDDDA